MELDPVFVSKIIKKKKVFAHKKIIKKNLIISHVPLSLNLYLLPAFVILPPNLGCLPDFNCGFRRV
jgi:hypothetical protein